MTFVDGGNSGTNKQEFLPNADKIATGQSSWSRQSTAGDDASSQHSSPTYSNSDMPACEEEPHWIKCRTTIILDWDDTLLCTSYLRLHEGQATSPSFEQEMRGIGKAVKSLLELCLRYGQPVIITNAVEGWVSHSAALYFPEVLSVLEKVLVISARAKFETRLPDEVIRWKTEAFLDLQSLIDPQITMNIVSIGDSNLEIDAAHVLADALDASAGCGRYGGNGQGVLVKTIKFRERPSPEELRKQLELVLQKFVRIVEGPKGLTITLERKWVGSTAPAKA